jgi:hypothetical protein
MKKRVKENLQHFPPGGAGFDEVLLPHFLLCHVVSGDDLDGEWVHG